MTKQVRVYSYGVHVSSLSEEHTNLVWDQLRKAHKYRNKLVEIERKRRDQYRALRATLSPELEALELEHARISGLIVLARRGLSAVPKDERDVHPAVLEIRRLRSEAAVVYKKIVALRLAVEREHFAPGDDALRAKMGAKAKAAKDEQGHDPGPHTLRRIRIEARAEIAKEGLVSSAWLAKDEADWLAAEERLAARSASGCYSGVYQAVNDAAARSFKDTQWQPRFAEWRGEGKVGVQVREKGGSLSAASLLLGGSKVLALRILPVASGRPIPKMSRRHAAVRMRLGGRGDGEFLDLQVVYHRPIPEDAVITWAYLVVRRVGTRTVMELQLTLEMEATERVGATRRPLIAVNLGFRSLKKNEVRVAMGWDGENHRELRLPPRIREGEELVRRLLSYAELHFNVARSEIQTRVSLLGLSLDQVEKLGLGTLGQWRSHGRLAALVRATFDALDEQAKARSKELHRRWRSARLFLREDLFAPFGEVATWCLRENSSTPHAEVLAFYLEVWRRKDEHLINWARGLQLKLARSRKDLYRVWAKQLAAEYEEIVFEDWNKSETAETPYPEDDMRTVQQELASSVRQTAGISVLADSLVHAFGVGSATRLDARRITLDHYGCGGESTDPIPEIRVHCKTCGREYDQDRNAAKNLLVRARERSSDAGKPASARKSRKKRDAA